MKKLFVFISLFVFHVSHAANELAAAEIKSACAASVEVDEGPYGKEYFISPTNIANYKDQVVIATSALIDGKTQIKLKYLSGGLVKEFLIPQFEYRRILLTENSVWFLSENSLREFSIQDKKILGTYSTYPEPFELQLTTRARGFTYQNGFIYIAHGELGVVVFDARNRQHYTVMLAGLQPASLAGAVQVRGNFLYVLQGAYHPQGSNGVAIVDLNYGSARFISYPPSSGVVDPYSSSMILTDKYFMINNSGWIHGYLLSNLHRGVSSQAPTWLVVSEKIETAGGIFDKFLMIEGDFVILEDEIMACSSVSYTPKGERRPVKEWRFMRKQI